MKTRIVVSAIVFLATSSLGVLTLPAEAAPASFKPDRVTVSANASVQVKPLANDSFKGKNKALVKVNKNSHVTTQVRKNVVTLTATTPGKYVLKYSVFKNGAKIGQSKIVFKVTESTDSLQARIKALPVAVEVPSGYDRDLFKHWNAGVKDDGCDTRREVLISEAVTAPTVGSSCSFTGGEWYSYYDGVSTTDSSKFDIDHMVPLKEAWDSGADQWSASKREAYANDQGDSRALVAVSASSNRRKSDRDPAEWMPPLGEVSCQYLTDWVAVKTRWQLTVDQTEKNFLTTAAEDCSSDPVQVTVWQG